MIAYFTHFMSRYCNAKTIVTFLHTQNLSMGLTIIAKSNGVFYFACVSYATGKYSLELDFGSGDTQEKSMEEASKNTTLVEIFEVTEILDKYFLETNP